MMARKLRESPNTITEKDGYGLDRRRRRHSSLVRHDTNNLMCMNDTAKDEKLYK